MYKGEDEKFFIKVTGIPLIDKYYIYLLTKGVRIILKLPI